MRQFFNYQIANIDFAGERGVGSLIVIYHCNRQIACSGVRVPKRQNVEPRIQRWHDEDADHDYEGAGDSKNALDVPDEYPPAIVHPPNNSPASFALPFAIASIGSPLSRSAL